MLCLSLAEIIKSLTEDHMAKRYLVQVQYKDYFYKSIGKWKINRQIERLETDGSLAPALVDWYRVLVIPGFLTSLYG